MTSKGKQIRISPTTLKRLEGLAHPGQSMDGVITEILTKYDLVFANRNISEVLPKDTSPTAVKEVEQTKNNTL